MSPFGLSTADKNLATFVITKNVNMNLTLLWYVALYRDLYSTFQFRNHIKNKLDTKNMMYVTPKRL